ncbi:hypothetical protein SDC9_54991 [bioreactor metagenome]|uniref:Uncharacterized protein n=1 Tax=bioreactor metagenome TaxID=1076179 RepID=A0A644WY98_9ZZZZ
MAFSIFYTVYIVFKYGINCPYWDEWDIVRLYHNFFENGFDALKLLSYQTNEHRNPVAVAL